MCAKMLVHSLTHAAFRRSRLARRFQPHSRSLWEASVLAAAWVTSSNNRALESPLAPLPKCGLSREAADAYSDAFRQFAERARDCYVDGVPSDRPGIQQSQRAFCFRPERPFEAIDELFASLRATEAPGLQHVAVEVASHLDMISDEESPLGRVAETASQLEFIDSLRALLGPALPAIVRRGIPGIADIQQKLTDEDSLHPLAVFSYGVQEVVDWHVWHASTLLR